MTVSALRSATLISAERVGGFNEDLYLLKPSKSLDPSVAVALIHLFRDGSITRKPPVLLWHGMFGNHRYFSGDNGQGIAQKLAANGFDVWIADWRGHGFSPQNTEFMSNSVWRFVDYDLPAIASFIAEQNDIKPRLIGADISGLMLLAAVSMSKLPLGGESLTVLMDRKSDILASLSSSIFSKKSQWRWKSQGSVAPQMVGFGKEPEAFELVRSAVKWLIGGEKFKSKNELMCLSMAASELPCLILENKGLSNESETLLNWIAKNKPNTFVSRMDTDPSVYDGGFEGLSRAFNHPESGIWADLHPWLSGDYSFVRKQQAG
ncbi:MAG: alpha/beta fold hydrolase [Hahellaceae bacterium]|nr:alpha/beta fold hydrolase [Hahellaceae bacterium]